MTNRGGRPRLNAQHPTTHVTVYLPAPDHDALCVKAARDGVSVAELIRRTMRRELHEGEVNKLKTSTD